MSKNRNNNSSSNNGGKQSIKEGRTIPNPKPSTQGQSGGQSSSSGNSTNKGKK